MGRSSWTCSAGASWAGTRTVRCLPSSCSTRWSRRFIYIATDGGWLYLANLLDLHRRQTRTGAVLEVKCRKAMYRASRRPARCAFALYSVTGSIAQAATKLHGPVWPPHRRPDSTAPVGAKETGRHSRQYGRSLVPPTGGSRAVGPLLALTPATGRFSARSIDGE